MAKKKRRSGKRGSRDKGFKYQSRSREKWEERAEQSGYAAKLPMVIDGVNSFRPKKDDNLIRILPPTWEDADHYGFEVYVHWQVGPDNDAFLCPKVMLGKPCPVCEEKSRALKDDDKDYADTLTAKKRVFCYVIDRDEEEEGLQLWAMPWTLDADVTTLAVDKRSGELLEIDDPKSGYDIEFKKTGTGVNTKYVGVAISRKSSKLRNKAALEEAIDMPVPDCLRYYPYEEIETCFSAGGSGYDGEEEEEDSPRKKKKKGRKKDKKDKKKDKKDKKGKKKKYDEEEEEEELTWGEIQEMDFDELSEIVDDEELEIETTSYDEDDDDDLEEFREEVCTELGLKKPKKRKAKKSEKKKLRKRGRR